MARPRTVTDEAILETARACFLEHGPSVPTTRIAEQVGLSQASLFKRFGSKQELMLQALMPPPEPPWLETLRGGPDERPMVDQLFEIAVAAGRFFEEITPAMMVLKASGVDRGEMMRRYEVPPPARALEMLTSWFQVAMDRGQLRRLDARSVALGFMGFIHGRGFLMHVVADGVSFQPLEEMVALHVDVLWRGLLPPEEAP